MGIDDPVNILLVDDQPARLLTYQTILSDLGQNLVLAHSGRDALDKLMHQEFAVVLLDVSMPEMDGFETAELIHAHPRFEKTPIIFVTGIHVSELDRLRGYKAGAVDYVAIPVVPEILRSKVAVLVELYCKRRELSTLNQILGRANKQLSETNASLQAEKTRELESLNATLQGANAELARTNRSLHREIAERARIDKALQEADRNKDEFLAMLAHELRNPLAPMLNALQLLRLKPSEAQSQWAQEVMQRQLAQLTRLVDDLLDVSRITRGMITLAREPLEVATLITRAVETVQPLLRERDHQLTLLIPPEPLRVNGYDPPHTSACQRARQRRQVHRSRRPHRAALLPGGSECRDLRTRQRRRHFAGAAAAHFRSVHAARPQARSHGERPRDRVGTRAPARGDARRQRDRVEQWRGRRQ